jgi:ankyrin repeat protein
MGDSDAACTINGHGDTVGVEGSSAAEERRGDELVAEDIFMLVRRECVEEAMQKLEAHPQHWVAVDGEGHSFLHWGALIGRKDFCLAALSNGCPVDARAANNQTPLMWACLRGHTPVARVLIDAKASIRAQDSLNATPLIIAGQHKNHKSMLLLLSRSKNEKGSLEGELGVLKDGDANGCTAAHWAAYKGDLSGLQLLNYFDADLQALDKMKMTPLHRAVCASQAAVIWFLLEHGCSPTQCNAEGKSCLDLAVELKDSRLQNLLRQANKLAQKGPHSPSSRVAVADGTRDLELADKAGKDADRGKSKKGGDNKIGDMQKLFPTFWFVCVSLATFQYLMDLRATSYSAAPTISTLFELGVPLSLAVFFWTALSDPGKIPARTKGRSGVEELMRDLDGGAPDDQLPDVSRLCTTTWVIKDLRTKYCTQTEACIHEFDHYCVWLNCAIGKGNHRQFIFLAMVEAFTQACHIYLCFRISYVLVEYQSFFSFLFNVVVRYPLLALMGFVQSMTFPWVMCLLTQHLRGVALNLTTNEMINMHRYEHFWIHKVDREGHSTKRFHNPFNKGSVIHNFLDFFWLRARSEVARPTPACDKACCKGKGT